MALTEEDLQAVKALAEAIQTPRPGDNSGKGTDWRGHLRATSQGLTAGFQDELAGGAAALFSLFNPQDTMADAYRRVRDAERAEQAAYAEANPLANLALQGAGTVVGGVGAAAMAPARLASAVSNLAPAARVLGGGATVGALEGLGRTDREDPLGIATETAIGAGTGALGGAAGAGIGHVGGAAGNWVKNRYFSSPKSTARRIVEDRLAAEGSDVAGVQARMSELGPGTVPADAPELTMLARATVPREAAQKLLNERLPAQGQSVREVLDTLATDNKMAPRDFNKSARALANAQKTVSKRQYDAAYAHDAPTDPRLVDDILERPAIKKAYEAARQASMDEGRALPALLRADESVPGGLEWRDIPGWEEIDRIQRQLRRRVDDARRAGRSEEFIPLSRARRDLLQVANELNPDFATARQTYAGFAAVKDAVDLGRSVMRPSVDVEDVRDMVADMTESELYGARLGLFKELNRMASNARERANLGTSLLSTPAQREKMALLVGEEGVERVLNELERTGWGIGVARTLATGSDTARQQMVEDMAEQTAGGNFVADALMGNTGTAIQGMSRMVTGAPPGLNDPAIRSQVGQAMLSPEAFEQLMGASPVTRAQVFGQVPRLSGPFAGGGLGGAIGSALFGGS